MKILATAELSFHLSEQSVQLSSWSGKYNLAGAQLSASTIAGQDSKAQIVG